MAAKDYDHLFKLLIIGELDQPYLLFDIALLVSILVSVQETQEWEKVPCLSDLQIIISVATTSPPLVC